MSKSTHSSASSNGAPPPPPPPEATYSPNTDPEGDAIMQEERSKHSPAQAQRQVLCKDENEVKLKPCADNLNGSRAPYRPNWTIATGDDMKTHPQRMSCLRDQLYEYTTSSSDTESKEAVWLKSSEPSTISLKLQDIQEAVGPRKLLDTDTLNMAIRKLVTEDESLGSWKHCLSSDFAIYALSDKFEEAGFPTFNRDEFPIAKNYHDLQVLCIPVLDAGHWSLYAFSMNDRELHILDSHTNPKRHAVVRLKICEALELTNKQFKLFSNSKFKLWDYKFAEVPQQNNSYDCGFFVFNFIRQWNGSELSLSLHLCYDTMEIRKEFLSDLLSFQGNEADQLPSYVSGLIKELSDLKNSWENGTMDIRLQEAVGNGDVQGRQRLLDMVARLGHVNMVQPLLLELGLAHEEVGETRSNNLEAMVVSSLMNVSAMGVSVSSQQEAADDPLAAYILRATNCHGETCLHVAVWNGHAEHMRMLLQLLADARLNDGTSPLLVLIRGAEGFYDPLFMAKAARRDGIVAIIIQPGNRYSPSDAAGPPVVPRTAIDIGSLPVDKLYNYTMSLEDTISKEAVWLSNSYPSPISLKLRAIQKTVKANGRMDADSLNFAIRKLGREDYKAALGRKHYISTDFASCAIYKQGGGHYSSLESCIDDDFLDHHNAFDQDANSYSYSQPNAEVLCIPVVHDGHWSLYAFNMNDNKLSILDPRRNCKCYKGIRLRICKALEFVKAKFNIFKNKSNDFSGWRYEVANAKECGLNGRCSDDDSGFLVFNYMRHWDGHQLLNPGSIPTDSIEMRKEFLAYILSFNDNESYQLPRQASKLIKALPEGPAWTRCEMHKDLLKALRREGNRDEFNKLFGFPTSDTAGQVTQGMREKLLRGTTCDGDGMFHIAVRLGKQQLLHTMKQEFFPSIRQENTAGQRHRKRDDFCITIGQDSPLEKKIRKDIEQTLPVFAESLRARNNKGETCLHEAVRRGDERSVELLILMDEKLLKCKTSTPPLVQREDYQGVSPLYLATTLRSADIVGFLTDKQRKCPASYAGPGGKTAMHAAVLSDRDAKKLTEQLLKWMKNVANIADLSGKAKNVANTPHLIGMADKSGNTPLHLLASVGGASIAELLLSHGTSRGESSASKTKMSWLLTCSNYFKQCCCCLKNLPTNIETSKGTTQANRPPSPCAALKKDSNGWFPIHVAAANGRVDVIKKLLEAWPDCMQSRNDSGQTFLHLAIEKEMRNVVGYVCGEQSLAGILNMRDRDGNTALHLAVKSGNQRMFCSLMSNKEVGLSYANKEGRTPLDLAILGIEPGLQFLLNSRVLIYRHLKISGSHHGTYRRDLLEDDKGARKLDKDKLSETITKSAGLMAVCAIFMLNISVTTFFNVAKQYLTSSMDPNTAAPPPLSVNAAAAAGGKSARACAFRALIVSDAITFASSSLAAFCSTFAGFSIMDRRVRFMYLNIAGFSLRIASMAVVAVFVLAAYLAFHPIDPHIATAAYVLPLVAVAPQLITPSFILLLHAWAILNRFFQNHVSPRLHDASTAFKRLLERILCGIASCCCLALGAVATPPCRAFQNHVSPRLHDASTAFKSLLKHILCGCCLALGAVATPPCCALALAGAIIAGIVCGIYYLLFDDE